MPGRPNRLAHQLTQMATDGVLDKTLAEWAHEIRLIGNAGTHPNTLDPAPLADAQDLFALLTQLLRYLYVMPAQVARARAARANMP